MTLPWDRTFDKVDALKALRDRGASGAVVEYSGGNDEGGVDGITLLFDGGEDVRITETWEGWGDNKKALTAAELADNALIDLLGTPVYQRYYSFAGDFYCSGEVVYDVAEGTVRMDGRESEESYHDVGADF